MKNIVLGFLVAFTTWSGLDGISNKTMPMKETTATVTNINGEKVTTDKGIYYYDARMKDAFGLTAKKPYNFVTQETLFGVGRTVIKYAAPARQ